MQGVGAGKVIGGRYTLGERRAHWGPLEVWTGTDSSLHRQVSLTIFPSNAPRASEIVDSARRAAGFNDHRMIRVWDVGHNDAISWIVEEPLGDSQSLAQLLHHGALPPEEARRITGEAAAALDAAAGRGLHHLRLDPHAVRRTHRGNLRIAGLAIAATIEGVDEPDSAKASAADALSLIGLLYAMLTTRWPLGRVVGLDTAPKVGAYVVEPAQIAADVPEDLNRLCRDVLTGRRRLNTPGEVAELLGSWSPLPIDLDDPVSSRTEVAGKGTANTAGGGSGAKPAADAPVGTSAAGATAAGATAAGATAAATADGAPNPTSSRTTAPSTPAEPKPTTPDAAGPQAGVPTAVPAAAGAGAAATAAAASSAGASARAAAGTVPAAGAVGTVAAGTAAAVTSSAAEGGSKSAAPAVTGAAGAMKANTTKSGPASPAGSGTVGATASGANATTSSPAVGTVPAAGTSTAAPAKSARDAAAASATSSPATASTTSRPGMAQSGAPTAPAATSAKTPATPAASESTSSASTSAAATGAAGAAAVAAAATAARPDAPSTATASSAGSPDPTTVGTPATPPASVLSTAVTEVGTRLSGVSSGASKAKAAFRAKLDASKAARQEKEAAAQARARAQAVARAAEESWRAQQQPATTSGSTGLHADAATSTLSMTLREEPSSPSTGSLEQIVPLVPISASTRVPREQVKPLLIGVAAFLAVSLSVAMSVLMWNVGDSTPHKTQNLPVSMQTSPGAKPNDPANPNVGSPVIEAATGFDPDGDREENGGSASKAHDGDPETFWKSESYGGPGFSDKTGVGVVFSLRKEAPVAKVALQFPVSGQDVEIWLSDDNASIDKAKKVATKQNCGNTEEFTIPAGTSPKRHIVVFFTKGVEIDGKISARLSEIKVS